MTERIYILPKESVEANLLSLICGIGVPVSVLTYLQGNGMPLAVGAVVLIIMVPLILRHTGSGVNKLVVDDAGIKLMGVDRDYRVGWNAIESVNLRSRGARGPVLELRLRRDVTWDWPDKWRSNSLQELMTTSHVFIPRLASESDEQDFYRFINDKIENRRK